MTENKGLIRGNSFPFMLRKTFFLPQWFLRFSFNSLRGDQFPSIAGAIGGSPLVAIVRSLKLPRDERYSQTLKGTWLRGGRPHGNEKVCLLAGR